MLPAGVTRLEVTWSAEVVEDLAAQIAAGDQLVRHLWTGRGELVVRIGFDVEPGLRLTDTTPNS